MAITGALDLSGGNLRSVQKLSWHLDPKTLMIYDDNRQDFRGEMTRLLGATLHSASADYGEEVGAEL